MRYVRAYCNIYSLVRLLQTHVAEVIQRGNDGGTATGVVQAAPAELAASPDVELAELIGAMDAAQDRARAETGLPWDLSDWEEWSQAICDREPIAAVRVAAAVARCAEDLHRHMAIEVDGRFQNIRSSMEEWILCPCDLHANRLDGMWRSARELAHYGHPDKSRHPEDWALGETDPLVDDCCCSLCGANWAKGSHTEGCEECDGGALLRPCGDCDGTCGVVWMRFVAASKQVGKARWAKVDLC